MREGLDQYLKDNIGLVHQAASKSMSRIQACNVGMDFDDLVQELTLVFIRSYEGFDPSKARFSTYFMTSAYRHINKLVEQAVRRPDGLSSSVSKTGYGEEGYLSLEDATPDENLLPDGYLQAQAVAAKCDQELSPTARRVLSLALNPPDEVEYELEAAQAQAANRRAQGFAARAPREITTNYILSLMRRTNIVTQAQARAVQVELESFARGLYA